MNSAVETREYTIKRLSHTNLADLEMLHTAVYNRTPPSVFFSLKYDTDFTCVKYVGFIAYNLQNVPVAFYGVIPCFIRINNKMVLAAQSADTMTHPQHRYKGLFVELAELTFDLCLAEDIQLVFGFPNQNSLHGAIDKLAFHMTDTMDCFIIKTTRLPWNRVFNKFPSLQRFCNRYRNRQLKKYLLPQKGVLNSVLADGFAGIDRSHHYLAYKTFTDSQVIKIDNALLWIKMGSMLLIGDMTVAADDFDEVMRKLRRLANRLMIREIHFHASPGTTLHSLFAARFSSIPSFPTLFKVFGKNIPTGKIKFVAADIDTF